MKRNAVQTKLKKKNTRWYLSITSFGRIQKQNVVFTQLSQNWFKMF